MSASTIAQKVATQARVIRSLNLMHCMDTSSMVGPAELEMLLKMKDENEVLRRRLSDIGYKSELKLKWWQKQL